MKCIVLAGGAGNRLWPLSRKNYPKQFVNLKNGHSLFQETIVRNMPFCDEFWIFTSAAYRTIVEGQLQPIQGVMYRCFCEEEPHKTAPVLALAALLAQSEEDLLVVSTDNLIEGDYKTAIAQARAIAVQGKMACLGVAPSSCNPGYGFLGQMPGGGMEYRAPQSTEEAHSLMAGGWLWDTGILLGRAGTFVQEMEQCCPGLLHGARACQERLELAGRLQAGETFIRLSAGASSEMPAVGFGPALTGVSRKTQLLQADFRWTRMVNLDSLVEYYGGCDQGSALQIDCRNTTILNLAADRMVAASGLQDALIVNTTDAVYVASQGHLDDIKTVMQAEDPPHRNFFEDSTVYYTTWGIKETMGRGQGYQVKKLTLYPGRGLSNHSHAHRSEHWSVVAGVATVLLDGVEKHLTRGQSLLVEPGQAHRLLNRECENLIIIETSVGDSLPQGVDIDQQPLPLPGTVSKPEPVRLLPACKDYLWGGVRLRELFGKQSSREPIAECWELSAHEAGQSRIAAGPYADMPFGRYLEMLPKTAWGWKCQGYEKFPLLIKFIDAKKNLSIQVHPGDDYALLNEGEYGKNEMWYIMEAKPGACLWCGFNRPITKAEIRERVQNGTLMEVLNRVPVQKGDTMMIPAGTVHAIGEGLVICEVQQSSNVTYRLYDYGRRDKNGALRTLHIEKALNVLNLSPGLPEKGSAEPENGGEILCQCKYFTVERLHTKQNALQLAGQDSSFTALVFLQGQGTLQAGEDTPQPYRAGDTFFLPAGNVKLTITGTAELLRVMV